MADKRITQIGTTYTRDTYARTTDYLIGDRSGGSSFKILAEEAVLGALENVTGNVGIGTTSPGKNLHAYGTTNTAIRSETTTSGVASFQLKRASVVSEFGLGSSGAYVGYGSALYFDIATITGHDGAGYTTRMRVDSSGNVGINTTSPEKNLHAYGTTNTAIRSETTTSGVASFQLKRTSSISEFGLGSSGAYVGYGSALYFDIATITGHDGAGYTTRMRVDSSGNVGIGTTSPGYKLHVNGSVAGTSAYNNLSDLRHKTNVEPLTYGLDEIMQLRPIRFDYIDGEQRQLGFGAQDVQGIIPEAISAADDGTLSLRESHIVAVLVSAVQELSSIVETLMQRVAALEQGAA